jgi:hypothetical protein
MGLLPPDFESGAYTNFATQARTLDNKTLRPIRQEQPRGFEILPVKFSRRRRAETKILQSALYLWLNFCCQNNLALF